MAQAGYYQYVIDLKDKISPKMAKAGKTMNSSLKNFDNSVNRTLGGVKGLVAAAGGLAVFKTAFDSAVNIQKNQIAFQTLTKDVEKGNKLFAELTEFANVTPFQTDEVQAAGKTLLAMGVESGKVAKTMQMVGDVAAITGNSIGDMAMIFGQIRSVGKLTGERLNQLRERGFDPLKVISEQTGESVVSLQAKMSKGLITFDMVEGAFQRATDAGGQYANGMQQLSETLGGKWSTMMGKLQNTLGEVMLQFQDSLAGVIDYIISLVDWMGKNTETIVKWVKWIAIAAGVFLTLVGTVKLLIFTINLLRDIKTIIKIMKSWKIGTTIMTAAQWALNVALNANPVGVVIMAIAALIGLLVLAYNKIDRFREAIDGIAAPFMNGDWEEGIKRVGFALIDSIIWPLKAILRLVAKLPGAMGETAQKAVDFLDNMTTTEKQREEKRQKNIKSLIKGESNESGVLTPEQAAAAKPGAPLAKPSATATQGIVGGGKKQTNINISLDKLIENMTLKSGNLSEGTEVIKTEVTKALLQVLNSANQLA